MRAIVYCNKCSLCKNHPPLFDVKTNADIVVVGLSSKIRKYNDEIPLDSRTRSGRLIDEFESIAGKYNMSMYRTNIVKGAPIDYDNRLRYPNKEELNVCFGIFADEVMTIAPKIVILLGEIVRRTVEEKCESIT